MKKKFSKIALIPARGGSKRVPKKNIIKFMNKPMIAHTIINAFKTNLFKSVYVSTDNEEIERVSKKYGAKVLIRNKKLSDDNAMVKDVCHDFLLYLKKNKINCDILCTLFATSPLRNHKDIYKVVNLINPNKCDFSLAVTSYDLPPHQALRISKKLFAKPKWPNLINNREKDRLLVDNGSTYSFYTKKFMKLRSFYGPKLKVYEMPRSRSVDLDTVEDLELLKFYSKCNK